MAEIWACRRLKSDYLELKKDPIPYTRVEPDNENVLVWYYCIKGPKETDYEGGYYYGELKFPKDYPSKPPSIFMNTRSGRFLPRTRLCLSISDHHPENWRQRCTAGMIRSILTGLSCFMVEEYRSANPLDQTGSIIDTSQNRKELARKSGSYNVENFPKFIELFPDMVAEILASENLLKIFAQKSRNFLEKRKKTRLKRP